MAGWWQPAAGATRAALETPCLVLDLDILERNIAKMLAYCTDNGLHWRPHAKVYKSTALAKKVVAAGAIGVTCAKLSEAEAMGAAGVTDLLIANQLVGPRRMERLVALRRIADPITVVDSPALVDAVSAAAVDGGVVIRTMVEVDIGMQRAGVPPGEPTVELARRIAEAPGLELIGIMGYEGHLLLEQDLEKKESAIAASVAELKATRDAVVAAGLPCPIVSAGGTGSYPFTAKQPGLTEIQAGGGVFMDLLYRRQCQILDLEFALTIHTTVVSRPTEDRAIMDAGRKTMNMEFNMPEPVGRADIELTSLSAEHGIARVTEAPGPSVGDRIALLPGYCDFTTVLHDRYYCFRGDALEEVWTLDTRGCKV